MPKIRSLSGFTLMEVLIVLGILGMIAAFSIPRIVTGYQDKQKLATFRECLSLLAQIEDDGISSSQLTPSNFSNFFLSRIQAKQYCSTNAASEGCWNTATQGSIGEETQPGVVLEDGAVIVGLSNPGGNQWYEGIAIDWNGTALPNKVGEDQLVLIINFGTQDYSDIPGGDIGPSPTSAPSIPLYRLASAGS